MHNIFKISLQKRFILQMLKVSETGDLFTLLATQWTILNFLERQMKKVLLLMDNISKSYLNIVTCKSYRKL